MRRVKVRVRKGRVVSPSGLPEDFDGELTLPDEGTREALLMETNHAYAALKANPKAWEEERTERALWDGTLVDGLGNVPPAGWDIRRVTSHLSRAFIDQALHRRDLGRWGAR